MIEDKFWPIKIGVSSSSVSSRLLGCCHRQADPE
jgi:hypothetical protein